MRGGKTFELLHASLGQEFVFKFRRDAVDQTAADGEVVFQQRFVGSQCFVDAHAFRNGDEGEGRGCGVAEAPADMEDTATRRHLRDSEEITMWKEKARVAWMLVVGTWIQSLGMVLGLQAEQEIWNRHYMGDFAQNAKVGSVAMMKW